VGTAYGNQLTFTTTLVFGTGISILKAKIHKWFCVPIVKGYGSFYNWYAATYNTGGVSIAPVGWHVPTYAEMWTLVTTIDPSAVNRDNNVAGGPMKEIGTTSWLTPNIGATNTSGFTAKGIGCRLSSGDFANFNRNTFIWNNEAYDASLGRMSELSYSNSIFSTSGPGVTYGNGADKKTGSSIRLIKDDSTDPGTMIDIDNNIYPTIKIGSQVWMAQNLRVTHYNNGAPIPLVTNGSAWSALTTDAMCYYNNDTSWQ
jgi:uncharacterized protein (TIGR02145 family)